MPSDLRRTRRVRATPPPLEDFHVSADYETEHAHTHEHEADWQRQLRRRRSNWPGFLIVGLGALALAGGLAFLVSGQDETKPDAGSVATNAATPAPDQQSASVPSAPARVEPLAAPPPARRSARACAGGQPDAERRSGATRAGTGAADCKPARAEPHRAG
ncbi:MAG TPA: hypothetical protein VKA90_08295 [Beijerinckiaceae bacterium]|nr:hypothetical protein [Beijerinckiaceae bacterium]